MIHSFEGIAPRLEGAAFIAPSADIVGDVEAGVDASIWHGAVIRGDVAPIRVGEGSNVQDGAIMHGAHGLPCTIGKGVTVGHGAIVHAATVGDWALIGMRATVLDGAVIGAESIVGAGALVTQGKSFPPRSMILGSPAKLVRQLSEEEVRGLHEHASGYVDLARRTASEARPG